MSSRQHTRIKRKRITKLTSKQRKAHDRRRAALHAAPMPTPQPILAPPPPLPTYPPLPDSQRMELNRIRESERIRLESNWRTRNMILPEKPKRDKFDTRYGYEIGRCNAYRHKTTKLCRSYPLRGCKRCRLHNGGYKLPLKPMLFLDIT